MLYYGQKGYKEYNIELGSSILEIYRVRNDGSELTNIYSVEYEESFGNMPAENIFIFKDKIILITTGINSEIRSIDFYGNDIELNL